MSNYSFKMRIYYLIIVCIWLLNLACKLKFNGLIFGMDYGLYQPDGALYTYRTLTFLGNGQLEAGKEVSKWYAENAFKGNVLDPKWFSFETNPMWDQYRFRVLYPVFSVPFVYFIGIPGMLVLPTISFLIFLICILKISAKYNSPELGIIVALVFSLSSTLNRWMICNITDGLLVAISSIIVLLLINNENFKIKNTYYILVLVVLGSLTRFSFLLWVSIAIVFAMYKKFKAAALIILTASFGIAPILFSNFTQSILPSSDSSLKTKLMHFPFSLAKITFIEFAQIMVMDRIFFLTAVIAVLLCLKNLHLLSSKYFLAVFIALLITGSINGTVGVNFRYQLPIIPFMAWVLIENIKSIFPDLEIGQKFFKAFR